MYKQEILELLQPLLSGVEYADIAPAPDDFADFCVPCFKFAKSLRKSPVVIANETVAAIKPKGMTAAALNGYINFTIDRERLAKDVLALNPESFITDEFKGKNIVIDYSSVNIAKPLGIAHLSSTAIGGALYRIFKYLGASVTGVNHLGDWGTQFGNLIAACKLWGDEKLLDERGLDYLLELYVKFHNEAEKDPTLKDTGRAYFKKIEDSDPECLRLFEKFKAITLVYAKRIFARLNIEFDSWAGEAFYNDKMQVVLDELEQKNISVISDGALIVPLGDDMPPALLKRRDGATLYLLRDLAAAFYRKKTYDFDKCLYVVAYQQDLHFKQLFKVLEIMGKEWACNMEHVAFGMVSVEGQGTLSTRSGKVVLLEDVLNAATEKAAEIIRERSPQLENSAAVASDVGIGAVVFSTLKDSRIKDVTFSYEKALNFDGETSPYIQYTHARIKSVLAKAPRIEVDPDYGALKDAGEVLKLLLSFSDSIAIAARTYEPCIIARHLIKLCRAFNRFYTANHIITDDLKATAARLELSKAVASRLKIGLNLLLINAPERM